MNLQHKFKFCLYLQNVLIKYNPHTYRSLPQHTSHVDFSNVNSTIRILFKIKISFQSQHWFIIIYIHGWDKQVYWNYLQLHGKGSWVQHKRLCRYQSWKIPWWVDTMRIFEPQSLISLHVCTKLSPHHFQMMQSRWILFQCLSLNKQKDVWVSELQSVTWLRTFVFTSTNYLICCLIFLVLISSILIA